MSENARFTVVRMADVDGYAGENQPHWHMVRRMLGIEAFGINAWRATAAGQKVIGEHDEISGGAGGHEEVYVVLSGHATFTVAGDTLDAPAGTVVFVRDPATKRGAVADEADTVVLVVGGKPGEAFTVSPWEASSEALQYWATEEWDRAIEVLASEHAAHPDHANVLYNLACAESRAGHVDDAIAHLEQAVALQDSFAETARDDPDFAPIRGDPRFLSA
jgi:hypothetical protein